MVQQNQDDSHSLLDELEGGWATPTSSRMTVTEATEGAASAVPIAEEGAGALAAPSTPDVDALDEGWLDDLFPEDDEDDEPEPLPDARLDPEAFARARKAREERAARKKEKKRAKAETKRARQKARASATRQKQKSKKLRPASANAAPAPTKTTARRERHEPAAPSTVDGAADVDVTKRTTSKRHAKSSIRQGRSAPSTMASVKLLALVLAILLALAAAAAAIFT